MADLELPQKTKALPWLKRMLDDDDSSDAASQLSDSSPKKETHPEMKGGGASLNKRRRGSGNSDEEASEIPKAPDGKRRLVRRGSSGGKVTTKSRRVSASSESSDSEDAGEGQSRRLKKAGNSVRHKHSHIRSVNNPRSAEDERSHSSKTADEAKSNAAAFREQRIQKLHALRVSSGEHDRLAAFKLKRRQSREALKTKERKRMRALRAGRGAHKTSAGAEADVEDEGESRTRPKTAGSDTRSVVAAAVPERKNKEEIRVVGAELTPRSTRADVKAGREDTQVKSPVGTTCKAVGAVKQEGRDQKSVTSPTVSSDSSVKVDHDRARPAETNKGISTASLLDMVPIPRKAKGESTVTSSVAAFVIPKWRSANPEVAGTTGASQDGRAEGRIGVGLVQRPLEPSIRVAMPPLSSPGSSPSGAKQEPIRPQKKRTKKFVPVKSSVISPQDRALMRLSRKRNSIFMAAAELAAQVPDARAHKKPTTWMTGYEVFDADGQTLLPDLIPRLSCATKREMGSNKESYPASFFGVLVSTPKAKGETAGSDGCDDSEQNARKICCYEELRFERPDDRKFYQQKMYGTTFVPQMLRGWITLIIRNARFERKSTGFRFNQGRDREEFAASLSKRYTINKSVPRCDIPRENWQKLMRNQPGIVYLHYYNREDAAQASRVFRDDLGQQLQLKIDYKAGVAITRSPSPGVRPLGNPRASCSSDSGAPELSPVSSQNGSARSTPSWRRVRQPALKNDLRYARYDRGAPPPPAPWPRVEGRYGPSVSGNKRPRALLERRSRSRSRSKSFHSQQYDSADHDSRGGSIVRERPVGRNESASTAFHSDAETPAWKRARVLARSPIRSRSSGQGKITVEAKSGHAEGRQEVEEIKSSTDIAHVNPVGASNGDDDRGRQDHLRSHLRRWQQVPNAPKSRQGSLPQHPRDRSRGPVTKNRSNEQQSMRDSGTRRSRSPPRASPKRGGRSDFNGGRHTNERRGSRGFGRGGTFDKSARERRMQSDRGRGGFNGRRGGSGSAGNC